MKNIHLFNRFKMNLIGYSKFLWKESDEKDSGSSGETRKPTADEVDLLVERGTVEDYVKRRTGEVMGGNREKALLKRIKALESGLGQANDTIEEMKKMFKENSEKQEEENKKLHELIAEQAKKIEELEKKPGFNPDVLKPLEDRLDDLEKQGPVDLSDVTNRLDALEGVTHVDPKDVTDLQDRLKTLEDADNIDPSVIKELKDRLEKLENRKEFDPDVLKPIKDKIEELYDRPEFDPSVLTPIRQRLNELENQDSLSPEDLEPITTRLDELEQRTEFDPDELRALGDRIIALENANNVDKKELAEIKSVLEDLQNQEMVDPEEYKDVKERVDKLGDIDMLNRKISHIAKLNERVNKIKGKLEVAIGKLDKINPEDIEDIKKSIDELNEDIANDSKAIHDKLNPLLSLPKKIEEIEKILINPQLFKELMTSLERIKKRLKDLEDRNTPPPKPTPPDKPGKPGNEGGIEDPSEKLGTPATLIANRIYFKLKDKMPRNWKFTAAYHHAKCWKYYNIRPGTNVKASEKGNTDEKYCLYDRQKDQYFYTDAWYHFLLRKLVNPEEYDKIMKFKPTKE